MAMTKADRPSPTTLALIERTYEKPKQEVDENVSPRNNIFHCHVEEATD